MGNLLLLCIVCVLVGLCIYTCAHMDAFVRSVCVHIHSPHCAINVVHKSTITSSPVPLLPVHYYLKGIRCTLTQTQTHAQEVGGRDTEVWMPAGIVTVPLSDPGVQKQLEKGIHLFLQWFTNTLYLCWPSSHRYAWRENTSVKRSGKKLSEKDYTRCTRTHTHTPSLTGTDWQNDRRDIMEQILQ